MNTREKIEFARNTIKPRQELMFHEIIDIVNHCEQINTKKGDDPKEAWFWAMGEAYLLGYAKGIKSKNKSKTH